MDQGAGVVGPGARGPLAFLGVQRIPTRSGLGIAMGIKAKDCWKVAET